MIWIAKNLTCPQLTIADGLWGYVPFSLDIYRRSGRRIFASSVIRPIRGPKWPKERSPGFTLGSSPHPN
jgi:hypothetical protein